MIRRKKESVEIFSPPLSSLSLLCLNLLSHVFLCHKAFSPYCFSYLLTYPSCHALHFYPRKQICIDLNLKFVKVQTPLARLRHFCATKRPFQGHHVRQVNKARRLDNTGERWREKRKSENSFLPQGGSSLSHILPHNVLYFYWS